MDEVLAAVNKVYEGLEGLPIDDDEEIWTRALSSHFDPSQIMNRDIDYMYNGVVLFSVNVTTYKGIPVIFGGYAPYHEYVLKKYIRVSDLGGVEVHDWVPANS